MKSSQSGSAILTWSVLSFVGIMLVVGGYGLYQKQIEKTSALSMQAMLVNVVIAQDLYDAKHHRFSNQWSNIVGDVARPAMLEVQMQANPQQPAEYFIGFGKNAITKRNGYEVSLSVAADGQSGTVTARRVGSWLFSYQLQRVLPDGKTQCNGKGLAKFVCHDFEQTSRDLEVENLVPVSDPSALNTEKSQN
ncbi:MAG: hypothetical protein IKN49_06595 [Elusimicrobiaceae bacterium]|nr:hypothetical protein [Elusimicrobiaceae bacterium]